MLKKVVRQAKKFTVCWITIEGEQAGGNYV